MKYEPIRLTAMERDQILDAVGSHRHAMSRTDPRHWPRIDATLLERIEEILQNEVEQEVSVNQSFKLPVDEPATTG